MELLRAIVNLFLLPPGINLLLLFSGLGMLRRAPRTARTLLWLGSGSLLLLAVPVVSNALTRATGTFAVLDSHGIAAQAIVVLSAERSDAPEYGGSSVGPHTLARVRMGAHLARETGLPVLFSGGRLATEDTESMAELMDRAFRGEFGLSARWLEEESRNTHENAERSAAILRAAGVHRVILVTHYVHMHRAVEDFLAAGIGVDPAPTDFPSSSFPSVRAALWPSFRCLEDSSRALHELYALLGRELGAPV